ncbi:MAG: TonB-dependent receptor, partial [Methylococcaceae bacterium]|nr:TonB-dependent receptor [Methylococcaceae bacterium]
MTPKARALQAWIVVLLSRSICADAQENSIHALEPITVTAQKRPESLYEVPMAVNVVSGEKIRNLTMRQLEDLAGYVPNLNISQGHVFSRLFIRGIGSGLNLGFEQSVGTFVDGIYTGRDRQSRIPLLDVERVEVLKGPQGILFGKNTTAGAINIVTAKPGNTLESYLSTFYAPDHGEAFAQGALSGPLAGGLSGRIAGRISHLDGYLQNTAPGTREPEKDEQMIRGSLRWDGLETLKVLAKYEYGHFKVQGLTSQIVETGTLEPAFTALDPKFDSQFNTRRSAGHTGPLFGPDSSDTSYHNGGLFLNARAGDHEISATTGYSQYEYDDLFDLDLSALSILGYDVEEEFRQFSQELRLDSPEAASTSWQPWNVDALEYLLGVYYQYQDLEINTVGNVSGRQLSALRIRIPGLGIPPPLQFSRVNRSEQQSHSWSAFGRLSWLPVEDWRITAGLRFTHESKTASKNLIIANLGTRNQNPVLARFAAIAINAVPHRFQGSRDENHLMP